MNLNEIPKNTYLFLKDLRNWQKFIIALILSGILLYFVGRESIDGYIKHMSEIEIERLKQEEREKIRNDSVRFEQAQAFWAKSVDDELELRKICEQMATLFTGETQISLFKLHDHGDVLAPENNPRVTVKWSSRALIQENYQNEPIYTGALWALGECDKNGFLYMPVLSESEGYWVGREKAFHESIGSKSAAFIHLKDIKKNNTLISKWFIAIHWSVENPYSNPYTIRIKMERFVNLLKNKIYIAPDYLRTSNGYDD